MKINLHALSPVHIGSGVEYQGNAEYLYFQDERVIVLADEQKVLTIIGEENIPIWINYIEGRQEDFLNYLRQRKPDVKASDIGRRIIPLQGNQAPYFTNTLREQMHGGMGEAYIPGTSIKGAIRTAIFAKSLMDRYEKTGIKKEKLPIQYKMNNPFQVKDYLLQKEVFGKNPNSDWMRMLQVGDCYFSAGTHAAFAETLNEYNNQRYEIKHEVRQLIEFLPKGTSASFVMRVPDKHLERIHEFNPRLFPAATRELSLAGIFQTVNRHSLRLLDSELEFFEDADLPPEMAGLLDFLNFLRAEAAAYSENECLLRLGFGTGYRSMTGDWVKELVFDDDLYDDIATVTRRTARYNSFPLPKSRKIMFDGELPGFVKLTLQNQNS
ncbi:type III-A CRISPR-associated RAMP protein Csm5 [Phaeodactylibacter xiamenensis]|uniref:type III-A CRISPR-associated RAMP protein Csm5 n=1 Tax=Phaeodactylibacter xiamenensis TaxID=1524460 RepID=UPI0024A8E6BF|nr:type III-A CRISPR-associated RAMP protein Csm5 [Phaeodactylibacter xiamenensis]